MTETWRPVVGFETRYEVSDLGRVRSLLTTMAGRGQTTRTAPRAVPLVLRTQRGAGRYPAVMLRMGSAATTTALVHALVLTAFVGPRPRDHQAAHANGIRNDNRLENLRWATVSENHLDKREHGTSRRGEQNNKARFTASIVIEIRARAASGEKHRDIAKSYGVAHSSVGRVVNRKTWGHV